MLVGAILIYVQRKRLPDRKPGPNCAADNKLSVL